MKGGTRPWRRRGQAWGKRTRSRGSQLPRQGFPPKPRKTPQTPLAPTFDSSTLPRISSPGSGRYMSTVGYNSNHRRFQFLTTMP